MLCSWLPRELLEEASAAPSPTARAPRFLLEISDGCRSTVVSTLITSANWVLGRIRLPLLIVTDHLFAVVQTRIIEQLGAETWATKEAPAIPVEIIKILERTASRRGFTYAQCGPACVFDDALHIKSSSLEFKEEGLVMNAWRTKTERALREPSTSLSGPSQSNGDWMACRFETWRATTPTAYPDNEFILHWTDLHAVDYTRPITYA